MSAKRATRRGVSLKSGLIRLVWFALLAALLWWALRNVPLGEIWASLRQLTLWQLLALLALNAGIIVLITMRWWLIVRAESSSVPIWPLVGYRLAAFGLSYFTFGPQVGGEPLQVLFLQKHYGLTFARATAAVIVDKLVEFLTNFLFLGLGLYAVFRVGILSGNETRTTLALIPLLALLCWPVIHLLLLYNRRFPLSAILGRLHSRFGNARWMRLIMVAERLAASFCRRHPKMLLASLGVSLLSWMGMAFEYAIMVACLHISLDFWHVFAGMTAMQLAFLLPLPGGLGALEASQVFVVTAFGFPAAMGISLSLLIRARDLLNGGAGLLMAGTIFER